MDVPWDTLEYLFGREDGTLLVQLYDRCWHDEHQLCKARELHRKESKNSVSVTLEDLEEIAGYISRSKKATTADNRKVRIKAAKDQINKQLTGILERAYEASGRRRQLTKQGQSSASVIPPGFDSGSSSPRTAQKPRKSQTRTWASSSVGSR